MLFLTISLNSGQDRVWGPSCNLCRKILYAGNFRLRHSPDRRFCRRRLGLCSARLVPILCGCGSIYKGGPGCSGVVLEPRYSAFWLLISAKASGLRLNPFSECPFGSSHFFLFACKCLWKKIVLVFLPPKRRGWQRGCYDIWKEPARGSLERGRCPMCPTKGGGE